MLDIHLGLALADGHEPLLGAEAPHDEKPDADERDSRKDPRQEGREPRILHPPGESDVRLLEVRHQPRILDTRRDELVRAAAQAPQLLHLRFRQHGLKPFGGQRTADGLLVEDEIAHLALVHERLERAIRQVLGVRSREHRLEYEHPDKGNHEVADRERPLFGLHLTLPFSAARARPSFADGARFPKVNGIPNPP